MWDKLKKIGFWLLLAGPTLGPVAAVLELYTDADIGVFDALRAFTCWLFNYLADAAQQAVVWTFTHMPGGLLDVEQAAVVYNLLLKTDQWTNAFAVFQVFVIWCNAMLFWTAIRGVRTYILKT